MARINPIILYSTITWLAFNISQKYYNEVHYVWCTPHFNYNVENRFEYTVSPTSCPCEIYKDLLSAVNTRDKHNAKIEENKAGIIRGALEKHKNGIISDEEKEEILSIVSIAETQDFKPLLFVIPFKDVKNHIVKPPIEKKAHPLSTEILIINLHRSVFDVIEFRMV